MLISRKPAIPALFTACAIFWLLKDGQISATIYPGPYCFEVTPDDEKETKLFEYSPEGLTETVDWLNQRYDEFYREKDSILTGDESLQ